MAILVTGASGQLGSVVIRELLHHVPASSIIATGRDVSKLAKYASQGIETRKADFSDPPATLTSAFKGAQKLLLISTNVLGAEAIKLHKNAIDAAIAAGVQTIYYTSHAGAHLYSTSKHSHFPPTNDHIATEVHLEESGINFVSLRNGYYTESLVMMVQGAKYTGKISSPQDGKVCWTSREDLGIAAARIMAADGDKPKEKYRYLTARKTLDMEDVAKVLTVAWGKPVTREVITEEQFKRNTIDKGIPAHYADMFLGFYRASADGDFALLRPDLEEILGRAPTTPEEFFVRAAAGESK